MTEKDRQALADFKKLQFWKDYGLTYQEIADKMHTNIGYLIGLESYFL